MHRNPIHQLADRIGMYAYLTAIGGLEYWPEVRRLPAIEEQRLSAQTGEKRDVLPSPDSSLDFDFTPDREKVSAS